MGMVAGFFELGEETSALWTLPSARRIETLERVRVSARGRCRPITSFQVWKVANFGRFVEVSGAARFPSVSSLMSRRFRLWTRCTQYMC